MRACPASKKTTFRHSGVSGRGRWCGRRADSARAWGPAREKAIMTYITTVIFIDKRNLPPSGPRAKPRGMLAQE